MYAHGHQSATRIGARCSSSHHHYPPTKYHSGRSEVLQLSMLALRENGQQPYDEGTRLGGSSLPNGAPLLFLTKFNHEQAWFSSLWPSRFPCSPAWPYCLILPYESMSGISMALISFSHIVLCKYNLRRRQAILVYCHSCPLLLPISHGFRMCSSCWWGHDIEMGC